ncbi:MAG: 50S ribosomal protein L15 [Myxococcales bacterium]|nr:50S ribosomal protein L15 [Myxococcales bacterium]
MSELSNLRPQEGSVRKKKRVGRGESSGLGKTAGVGHKGQKARQGMGKPKRGFEGGQMPLYRRLPKRGFISRNRTEYAIINVGQLAEIEANTEVDINYLRERGMIKKGPSLLKVLGDGELGNPLVVYADKFSAKAAELITQAGGQTKSPAEQDV